MRQRTLLITGCSSGIGYDAAKTMTARDGWRVVAACRKAEDVERLESEGIQSVLLDYESFTSIHEGFAAARDRLGGRIDALFNNGAFALPGALEDLPTGGLRAIFEANFFGWHELTRLAIPDMRRAGWGRIAQCSSVLGFTALKFRGAYQSTKFALEGYSDTLRIELEGSGVSVCLIEPGPVTSRIRENSKPHFLKWIDWENSPFWSELYRDKLIPRLNASQSKDRFELGPEAVTAKLIHALEAKRPKPRYYVTRPTHFMGAMKRLLPTRGFDRICVKGSM